MRSIRTKQVNKLLAKLPPRIQKEAKEAYEIFRRDPYYNSLDFHQIDEVDPIYAARVGRHHRAVGWYENGIIRWYWIGSHEDYNHLKSG